MYRSVLLCTVDELVHTKAKSRKAERYSVCLKTTIFLHV